VVTERWVNYADRKDPVAFDVHLRDDYGEIKSKIRVEDDLVLNDYPKTPKVIETTTSHTATYGLRRCRTI